MTERGADIFVIGTGPTPGHLAGRIALPSRQPDELSPVLKIFPSQKLALHLAIAHS
ncbi:hypothetical protein [Mycobacterium leprae]|uniref:hypothetical protein n=1 Tax=Mycobacterium leprae TaxID=1769 RepID=UPI0012E6F51A|nr:hypothetical protein [Mycobacterium leprae]